MKTHECRLCGSKNLELFLDLGATPPSDAFLTKEQLREPEEPYPLDVYLCRDCGQAQLGFVVPPEVLYRRDYPYESSTTRTGREHFHGMAASLVDYFGLPPESLVIDVGSNVGVLLEGFKKKGMRGLGVDPATDMAKIANKNGIETLPEFFTAKVAEGIRKKYGPAALVVGTNVFAHIHDVTDAVTGMKTLIGDTGAVVIEAPHFLNLVRNLEYDTIYHEHLSYLSVKPLQQFFRRFDMELFNVEEHAIHGGTIRFFAGPRGVHTVSPTVAATIAAEGAARIHSLKRLRQFADEVAKQRQELRALLTEIKGRGQTVVGVSAPAKGNTLLNYCGITTELLPYITEKAKIKLGLYTPGTRIPIVSDEHLLRDQPDYALILAWNFADEIMANLAEYRARGGRFIIPIPEPTVI